ncbi:hypothetical protein B0H13DRAFT_159170 [Mycena leptocephala]|nr:hypothetical protein B0H13DRAFT_159170 [Mycena leptocephala]
MQTCGTPRRGCMARAWRTCTMYTPPSPSTRLYLRRPVVGSGVWLGHAWLQDPAGARMQTRDVEAGVYGAHMYTPPSPSPPAPILTLTLTPTAVVPHCHRHLHRRSSLLRLASRRRMLCGASRRAWRVACGACGADVHTPPPKHTCGTSRRERPSPTPSSSEPLSASAGGGMSRTCVDGNGIGDRREEGEKEEIGEMETERGWDGPGRGVCILLSLCIIAPVFVLALISPLLSLLSSSIPPSPFFALLLTPVLPRPRPPRAADSEEGWMVASDSGIWFQAAEYACAEMEMGMYIGIGGEESAGTSSPDRTA